MEKLLYEYDCEHGKLPDVETICEMTGKYPHTVLNILNHVDYPKEMLLSPQDKQYVEAYRDGMKPKDMATLLGISIHESNRRMRSLCDKGLVNYKITKRVDFVREKPERKQYVSVREGTIYAHARGYVDTVEDCFVCNLWDKGKFIEGIRFEGHELVFVESRCS
jgi:hypothetical protein